jgi:AAA+ ATPase superfamily predicted ATPase
MERLVNREDELSAFRDCYESDDADMVVIYGRRQLREPDRERINCKPW